MRKRGARAKDVGNWGGAITKVLPGDHIHFEAPSPVTDDHRAEALADAQRKREAKLARRAKGRAP